MESAPCPCSMSRQNSKGGEIEGSGKVIVTRGRKRVRIKMREGAAREGKEKEVGGVGMSRI